MPALRVGTRWIRVIAFSDIVSFQMKLAAVAASACEVLLDPSDRERWFRIRWVRCLTNLEHATFENPDWNREEQHRQDATNDAYKEKTHRATPFCSSVMLVGAGMPGIVTRASHHTLKD